MIGIIGAMNIEVKKIIEQLTDKTSEIISGVCFVSGKFYQSDVVVAVSGVGKVNSAIATEAMILKYSPELVINTGVAGTLSDKLNIGDVALSADVVEHDMDTSPLGDPKGFITGLDVIKMKADTETVNMFAEVLSELQINYEIGTIASGDQFINSNETKNIIKNEFGAICCEMEGASIGHVCALNNVPFCVLRAISDGADDSSHMSYEQFTVLAAENSVKVLDLFFKKLK